jgi:hypothetical protein
MLEFVGDVTREIDGLAYRDARIVLHDFAEQFPVVLELWSERDYERQWRDGARRIVDGWSKSCLVTSIATAQTVEMTEFWAPYRLAEEVVVHQVLIPTGQVDPDDVYAAIPDYDCAASVSDWRLDEEDLAAYAAALS